MQDAFVSRRDPRFAPLLDQFGLLDLDQQPDTIYGLWPDLTLAYLNPAWFAFAASNGGEPGISDHWPIGRLVLDAVPECLKVWYQEFFSAALAAGGKHPPQHEYECSSADLLRRYLMTVYPLHGSSSGALLVVNSLLVEVPHLPSEQISMPPVSSVYVDDAGLIHQCAHCRRVRTVVGPTAWHWVPEWVRCPQLNVSHTLCNLCLNHYYPVPTDEGDGSNRVK